MLNMDSCFEVIDGFRYRRTVRAIIVDTTDHTLLIQPHGYKSDTWTLVGGGIAASETKVQAVQRELREETGLVHLLQIQEASQTHRFRFPEDIKLRRGLTHDGQSTTVFLVRVPSESAVRLQAEEIKASRWVPLRDADNYFKVAAQRDLFRQVIAEFSDAQVVSFTG